MKDREAIDILVRKRPKQHAIDNTEDNGGCTDTKGEGEDGYHGEPAVLAQIANSVEEIAEEVISVRFPAGFADFFFDGVQGAEFEARAPAGFFGIHTRSYIVSDLAIEVELQFSIEQFLRL